MQRVQVIFVILAFLTGASRSQGAWGVDESEDVAVLTDKNFDGFIASHPLVFVKFYAPWCGHCKSMAPGYSELARHMKTATNSVPIAKLDGTVEKTVAGRFAIQGYPTLKLFKNGQPYDDAAPEAANYLKHTEVSVGVNLGVGPESSTVWTCDLSADYVRINADYRT